jgi:hypothetical protein
MNIDPLANLYFYNSPFNFVKNDPVLYFNVDGNFRLPKADQNKYKALSSFLQNDIHKLLGLIKIFMINMVRKDMRLK